jgi:hypothetical protein
MESLVSPVNEVVAQLMRRAREPRVKLLGFDAELSAIAVAFEALSVQYTELITEVVRMRLRLDELAPPDEHDETCECRLCCLARMVSFEKSLAV